VAVVVVAAAVLAAVAVDLVMLEEIMEAMPEVMVVDLEVMETMLDLETLAEAAEVMVVNKIDNF